MRSQLPKKIEEELELKIKSKKIPKKLVEKIKKKVIEAYEKAKAEPGEAVGVVAAQSLGEPATQAILRSFHFAGVAELQLTLGLPRLIEVVDAKKKPSTPYMEIYLKEPYNKDKEFVEKLATKIREIKIEEISKRISIDISTNQIIVELDKNTLKKVGMEFSEVVSSLKKGMKSLTVTDYNEKTGKITLKVAKKKKVTIKDLYMLKEKLKSFVVRGIKGISDVLPVFDENLGEYVIKTYGSNLKEVMKIPEVDETRVYTNNIMEIYEVLGIEAARAAIVKEIVGVLEEQGLDVDIRHVLLLADVMTFPGKVLGITRYGVSGEKPSVLARAAFEIPIRHFILASISGEEDKFQGVVENVMANQLISVGTGLVKLLYKPKEKGKKKKA